MDWGQHTTVVEPVRFQKWHHGDHEKVRAHSQQAYRREEADVSKIQGMLANTPKSFSDTSYSPTSQQLHAMQVTAKKEKGATMHHGVIAPFDNLHERDGNTITDNRPGRLPVIIDMHRSGTLSEGPSKGEVERNMRAEEKRVGARIVGNILR